MAQIDEALTDLHLTTVGRLNAVTQILANYKRLTGKEDLRRRQRTSQHSLASEAAGSTGNWPLTTCFKRRGRPPDLPQAAHYWFGVWSGC